MKRVHIGIVGGGAIAKAHIIGLRGLKTYFARDGVEAEVDVIADVNPTAAKDAAAEYGVANWSGDWQSVIDDPAIEAITIATPNDIHAPVAIAAAKAGKHILCEKPLAQDVPSARAMTEAAEQAGIVATVDLNYRNVPAIQYAKRLFADGELGEVLSFRAAYLQDWGLNPNTPRSWKFEKARAGAGPMLSLGAHVVDLAHYFVGPVDRVVASARTQTRSRPLPSGRDTYATATSTQMAPVDIEDQGAALVEFQGGAIGTLTLSRLAPGRKNHFFLEISGSKGSVVFDYERMNEIQVWKPGLSGMGFARVIMGPEHDGGLIWTLGGLGVGFAETIVLQMRAWVAAIASGGKVTPSFADGLRAQEVIGAALISAESGRWEQVHYAMPAGLADG